MLREFVLNNDLWHVRYVNPNNPILIDRSNVLTVGVTDLRTMTVYLANNLRGGFLQRVLIHELGHCTLFSFGLINDIHRMVKKRYWIEAEEMACNFIADYGSRIFGIAYSILGDEAIHIVPYHIERLVS